MKFGVYHQRVLYNKTRDSVEIYTTPANKLPRQKDVRIWILQIYATILFTFEQFLVFQLYHPFLWHAYEVQKLNFIFF
jgi:hypothetical protein